MGAWLVKGINAGREFKTITSARALAVRKPQHYDSMRLLSAVVDASKEAGAGVDNITLNMTMCCLMRAQKSAGDEKSAEATKERMVSILRDRIFRDQEPKLYILQRIEEQAKEALQS